MKDDTDFNHIEPRHDEIHKRLLNWARYVSVRGTPWFVQPMFKYAKTPKTREADLHVPIPVNQLDGHTIEKAVQKLPEQHRAAIRWWYVHKTSVISQRKAQGLTSQALAKYVTDGRQMLVNTSIRENTCA